MSEQGRVLVDDKIADYLSMLLVIYLSEATP